MGTFVGTLVLDVQIQSTSGRSAWTGIRVTQPTSGGAFVNNLFGIHLKNDGTHTQISQVYTGEFGTVNVTLSALSLE